MRESRDRCRDVTLASGETIRVRGRRGLGPAGVAALSELVEAVRAKAAERGHFELSVCAVFGGVKNRCESFAFADHDERAAA